MMTKHWYNLYISACFAAFLLVACQAPSLEEITPDNPDTEMISERTTIPYSLTVSTEGTRVSYAEGGSYAFDPQDKLEVVGLGNHSDLQGFLSLQSDGTTWSGELSYLTDNKPDSKTEMKVTLIHAGTSDSTKYAKALVGSEEIKGSEKSLLQYAVEHYSLFTAQPVLFTATEATLFQKAAFLDVKFTFDFDGSHTVQPGKAFVDLNIGGKDETIETQFYEVQGSGGEDFYVNFIAVVPGGISTKDFTLKVGDRTIDLGNTTLTRNKKYNVSREIAFHPTVGDPFWSDGLYGRLRHPDEEATIVGIVVYVHRDYQEYSDNQDLYKRMVAIDSALTEKRLVDGKSCFGHGLVMALTNAKKDVAWSGSGGKIKCTEYYVTNPDSTLYGVTLSGYSNTESILTALVNAGAVSGSAAELAKNYKYKGVSVDASSTTGWFLPSIGQWMYTISEFGFGNADPAQKWINGNGKSWLQFGYGDDSGNLGDLVLVKKCSGEVNVLVKALNDRLEQFRNEFNVDYDPFGDPTGDNNVSDNYWTSSEKDKNNALRMNLGTVRKRGSDYYSTIKVKGEEKTKVTVYTEDGVDYKMKVRPFLAF